MALNEISFRYHRKEVHMYRLVTIVFLGLCTPVVHAADTLRESVWNVTSVERGGKPSDDFTGSESMNGHVTAEYSLTAIEFKQGKLIVTLGTEAAKWKGQTLVSTTSRLPAGPQGKFRIKLLGKQPEVRYSIDNETLVLTIHDAEQPLVIKAKPFPNEG